MFSCLHEHPFDGQRTSRSKLPDIRTAKDGAKALYPIELRSSEKIRGILF